MCVVVEQHINNNYYITLVIENRYNTNYYLVECCPLISDGVCGYPERSITYPITEKKKAYNTFKRYVKKYI